MTQDATVLQESLTITSYFSNQTEQLYLRLKETILEERKEPFSRSLIIVPSPATYSYLLMQLTKEIPNNSLIGIDILSFEEARIINTNLTQLDIETHCTKLVFNLLNLTTDDDFEKECTSTIKSLLKIKKSDKYSIPEEKKIFSFIKRLSNFFYKSIFYDEKSHHNDPFHSTALLLWKYFIKTTETIAFDKIKELNYPAVHLFSFTHIPDKWHKILEKVSEKTPVFYYILSPCMHFWSDLLSDSSLKILQQKIEEKIKTPESLKSYNDLLFDRNQFLANSGKESKIFAQLLENMTATRNEEYKLSSAIKENHYFEPLIRHDVVIEDEKNTFSLLEAFQANILLLRGESYEKIEIEDDKSIQIHQTPSHIKEIEILYDELLKLKTKNLNEFAKPSTVLVGAPNISKYIPYINRVFGERKERSFSYQIIQNETLPSSLIYAFKNLLMLAYKRISADALYELYTNTAFLRKTSLPIEDLPIIKILFSKSGFVWGINSKNREEILEKEGFTVSSPQDMKGTWEDAEKRLINSHLFLPRKNKTLFLTPQEGEIASLVVQTQRKLLGCLLDFQSKRETLSNWVSIFDKLLDDFFEIDFDIREENIEHSELKEIFALMRKSAKKCSDPKLSFQEVTHLFLSATKERSNLKKKPFLNEVIFAPIEFIKGHPSKIIALIGMESTDDPEIIGKDFSSNVLDAILSARSSLYISYQSYYFEDDEKREPQAPIKELIRSLDEEFLINNSPASKTIVVEHDISEIPIIYKDIRNSLNFRPTPVVAVNKKPNLIDLQSLRNCARSPLKSYFQNFLDLSLFQKDDTNSLKHFDLFDLKKGAFSLSSNDFLETVSSHIKIETHPMKEAYLLHFEEEGEKFREKQKSLGLQYDKRIIELSIQCTEPQEYSKNHILLPAPKIELDDAKETFYIVGTFDNLQPEGLLLFSKKDETLLLRNFPDILMLSYLSERYPEIQKSMLYHIEEEVITDLTIETAELSLKKFIQYSFECEVTPSFLYPNLIKPLIKGDDEFLKNIKDASTFNDPYLSLFMKLKSSDDFVKLLPQLRSKALDLFAPILSKSSEVDSE